MNDRSLTDIYNRRLLNLKEKTLETRFAIIHVPSQNNLGADAASSHPAGQPDQLHLPGEPPWLDLLSDTTGLRGDSLAGLSQHENDTDTAENNATVAATTTTLEAVATVVTWGMVREATTSDKTFLNLIHYLEVGFPADCRQLPA